MNDHRSFRTPTHFPTTPPQPPSQNKTEVTPAATVTGLQLAALDPAPEDGGLESAADICCDYK